MRLLFAITVCCFFALMWIALALARRIRLAQLLLSSRSIARSLPGQEFFEAGEFRTPRALRLEQEILQQKPRRPLSEIVFKPSRPLAASRELHSSNRTPAIPEPIPIRSPATTYASLFGETIEVVRPDSHLQHRGPEAGVAHATLVSPPVPFTIHRKPPQIARTSGLRRRVDLSHFNKDMGDLTDPYTHPLRGSGTQGPVPTDRTNR